MGRCPTVETKRLLLRPFREEDVDAYAAVLQTRQVRASLHLPDDVGREQAWLGIAQQLGQWELRGTGQWALEEQATGTFVGRAGMHFPERADWPGIEIGWALHPDHWGKGFATEAGAAAVEYAFVHHPVDALYSVILPENTASQAVARRLGFTLWEQRTFSHFPAIPHGIWRLQRTKT
ncbi:MAG: GNAT family N-acetyltransferase [Actinomycetota bacterium]|nr:GNAT family N-acetyltransferase [Actinomycetota bacterium]